MLTPPPDGLSEAAWFTAGLAMMMVIWWSTGPVPLGITGLLPALLLPLAGVTPVGEVTSAYGNPLVFLFLGGFLLGAAVQRRRLHRRIAYSVVRLAGTGQRALVLGFMMASALLSMWISNTAAVILMLPVALSVIGAAGMPAEDGGGRRFAKALLLGLAYGASIGGIGTLVGSPTNALTAGYLDEHGAEVSFARWSFITLPFVILFIPAAWLILTRLVFPLDGRLGGETAGEGLLLAIRPPDSWSTAEIRVALVFAGTACLWVARPVLDDWPPLAGLSDTAISLASAILLFLIPAGGKPEERSSSLIGWEDTQSIPWQILLMFGGGLALASAIESTGLAGWIGSGLAAASDLPDMAFVGLTVSAVVMLTELASNTATVAALLPVMVSAAQVAGHDPVAVSIAIAMAASCAFMLPVATPPNAIIFASGHVTVGD
ncbi:MAG: DASS family sodium-coupled anion symporter, partial [Oscillatoria sp. Prado101]|nr:DASS family sodium-coupled anion symporter [Oscillatoria sp. Prado101]